MKCFIYIFFLSGLIIFGFFNFTQAASPLDIVINEIAWMGTSVSYNDEWIVVTN